jgi:hypothetical protein
MMAAQRPVAGRALPPPVQKCMSRIEAWGIADAMHVRLSLGSRALASHETERI